MIRTRLIPRCVGSGRNRHWSQSNRAMEVAAMTKRLMILGAGTGGTLMANRLRKAYDEDELEIAVVDRDDRHVYQPGLLFLPFGLAEIDEIVRPRARQLHDGISFLEKIG